MIDSGHQTANGGRREAGGGPRVSVLMSVYNSERYLREAVESILDQTFTDFEFIIINDGSTDSTATILDSYTDPRIVRLHNPQNIGLTRSLNRGLTVARGEFVARQDADDISLPSRFAKQVDYLDRHPEVGVLGTQMEVMNEAGETFGTFEVPCPHSMIAWTLLFERPFAHPSVMMRRTVIERAGGYDQSFRVAQDYELWSRLVECTQFANLSDSLARYRTHTGAICRQQADAQYANVLRARQGLVSRILGKDIPIEVLEWVHQSQLPKRVLTDGQIERVIALILDLYSAMSEKGLLKGNELDEIYEDMLRRIIAASRCATEGVESIPRAEVARVYWRSVLPGPLWRGVRALANPRRAAPALLQRTERITGKVKRRNVDKAADPAKEHVLGRASSANRSGITVVVLSYERMKALEALLRSLLQQELAGIELELIICNNSPRVHLKESSLSRIGRLLRKFADVKILNSNYNWRCQIRYAVATLAKHETILFIDDDIILVDPHFIRYVFDTFQTLRPVDILSCWNTLWVEWGDAYLGTVSMSFGRPEITELTESDTCGPGICMYNKQILNPKVLRGVISPDFPKADDMAFSLTAALECGSRTYYLPSCGMLKFHNQRSEAALHIHDRHYDDLYALYKSLLNKGYEPVLSRLSSESANKDSPEQRAARTLPVVKHPW